ncbi:MAG: hypothetical protein ABIS06_00855 [Vicinamibacterales bacterium]
MRTGIYLVAALLVLGGSAACSDPPPPVQVDDNTITVLNQTSDEWRNVLITVNDHYRGGAPVLKADGRLNAPISQFATGLGQRWVIGTLIRKVEVTARTASGEPINLSWDPSQRKRKN